MKYYNYSLQMLSTVTVTVAIDSGLYPFAWRAQLAPSEK